MWHWFGALYSAVLRLPLHITDLNIGACLAPGVRLAYSCLVCSPLYLPCPRFVSSPPPPPSAPPPPFFSPPPPPLVCSPSSFCCARVSAPAPFVYPSLGVRGNPFNRCACLHCCALRTQLRRRRNCLRSAQQCKQVQHTHTIRVFYTDHASSTASLLRASVKLVPKQLSIGHVLQHRRLPLDRRPLRLCREHLPIYI